MEGRASLLRMLHGAVEVLRDVMKGIQVESMPLTRCRSPIGPLLQLHTRIMGAQD